MNKLSRGFTLFEILIVVVIIGLLATVLVASLDPLEAIRKTNDTALITVLTNIQNGFATYGANEGIMPWDDTDVNNCNGVLTYTNAIASPWNSGNVAAQLTGSGAANGCIKAIIDKGYLKASVLGALNTSRQNRVYFSIVRDATAGDKVIMCFRPESRDIKKQMNWGTSATSQIDSFDQTAAAGDADGPKAPVSANNPYGLWCSF